MNCPGCGGVNRDGARFCIGCGASLALRCQSCGNELPPQARFCDGCGSPVTGEPEVAEPVAAARKVVTVVFADITGSTALEERLDAEAVRALLDRIYAALRKDVEDHGGRVVKFTGDGLMAAFGVPEVGEDDAGQAAAAAVAMLQTMAGIAAETAHTLALKAGINTGEVVVIEEDDDVVGDSVNVASRLEAAAGSGEILVGETTWRLTRSSFAYEAIDPLLVKGKSEPVPAYRLLSMAAVADEVVAPPFVGRDGELSRLLEVFDEAVEANAARLVTIVGSPGVGKTRLAHELAAHLAGRAMVRESRCDPAAATFAPIAETIREAGAIQEAASEQEILDALEAMLPEDEPDRDRIATYVGAVLGAGKPGSTEQTFWALRKLIETRAAADVPRVLILDDLHWAEPLLLDLVEHLAEWIRAAPVLLVGTGRPELRDKRPSLAEGGRAAAVISLEGLDYESTEQLAMGLLGTQDVPTELLARIPSSTEGNPLFVRELVRMLVDDGILRREDDAWRLTVDVEAVEVPPTIQSLLAARMDRLEADERTVLELASVIGKEFYRGAVAELAAPAVREVLEECLERLRRKELVEPVGTYWIDEPVYRFHHALIRDAAYRRLLKETRADLHERVATWFEAKTSGLVGEHEEAIGYHLEQAHEYKRQLGKQDDELGARAAELLGTATRRALDRDDLPGAAALAGRALERLPEGEQDERAELLLMRCEALLSMGDVTHGGPAVDDFLSLATTPRLSAWAACFSGQLANLTAGGLPHTETSVAAAAGQLTELGDMAGAAKAHTVRATALAGLGRYGECEAALDEALTAARQAEGRRRSVTATLGTAPQAQVWGPNPVSRAGGRCLDLVRLLRITTGSLAVEQTSMRCQAVLEAFRGRADAARSMLRRARRKLTELGLEHELLETEQFAGFVELVAGDAAAALPHLEAAHEGFRRFGSDVLAAQTASLLAFAHVYVGEVEEAEACVDEAERLASRDLRAAMAWRTAKAEVLAQRGLFEEARALAEEAVRLGEPSDALVDHGMAYRQLAAVLRAAGDAAGAQRAEERAFALFERKGATALMGEPIMHPRPAQLAAVPGSGPPENEAIRQIRRFNELWAARDWDGIVALWAEDVVQETRLRLAGSLEGPFLGRQASREWLDSMATIGVASWHSTPLATRGERLVLMRSVARGSDPESTFETEVLAVSEFNEKGRLKSSVAFESDDLDAALAELDERYLAGEGAAFADVIQAIVRFEQAIAARDWSAVRLCLSDDFVLSDKRPAYFGELSAERWVQALQEATDVAPEFRSYPTTYLDIGPKAAWIQVRNSTSISDVTETYTLVDFVVEVRYGRFARASLFPPEDLDAARARFEELARQTAPTSRVLENEASRAALRWLNLATTGQWDELASHLGPQHQRIDRRQGLGSLAGRDEVIEGWKTIVELGEARHDMRVVATRGERLALLEGTIRTSQAFEIAGLAVAETDSDGHLVRLVLLDDDAHDAAFAELDERFIAREGAPFADVVETNATVLALWNARDFQAATTHIDPDFVLVDHRPLGFGTVEGVEPFMEVANSLAEVAPDARRYFSRYHVLADGVALVEQVSRASPDPDSDEIVYQFVVCVESGRWKRGEIFPEDDLDAALARFEELAGAGGRGALLENAATRLMARQLDALKRRDWDALRSLYADDLAREDARSGLRDRLVGAERYVEEMRAFMDLGFDPEHEILATRGDRSCLVRFTGVTPEGNEVQGLSVVEVAEDGRMTGAIRLDPDDLDAAFAELDERFAVGEGAPFADEFLVTSQLVRAVNARDWSAVRAGLTDDFVLSDRRPASFGDLTADQWVDSLRALADVAPDSAVYSIAFFAGDRGRGWGLSRISASRSDLTDTYSLNNTVAQIRDGKWARAWVFPPEEPDAARACYEALAEAAPSGPPENECLRMLRRNFELARARDWDELAANHHEEATGEDRRHLSPITATNRAEVVEQWKSIAGFIDLFTVTPIATRGEHLALLRLDVGEDDRLGVPFGMSFLQVDELDEDGLFRSFVTFEPDDLDAAMAELDERFIAGEGAPHAKELEVLSAFIAVWNDHDWGRVPELLHEDLVTADHRTMGWGTTHGVDAFLDATRTLAELAPGLHMSVPRIHRLYEGIQVIEVVASGEGPHGGQIDLSLHAIALLTDGRVRRMEMFDDDDLQRALARVEELKAEPAHAGELRNAATELLELANDAFNRGDNDAFAALLAEDAVHEDRRKGIGHVLTGRDKLVENFEAIHALGQATRTFTPIAIRGERLVMSLTRYGDPDGANEVEMVRINYLDDQGRFAGSIDFDLDDLDAAFAELDERYATGEGAPYAGIVRATAEAMAAWNARDWDRFSAAFVPDLEIVNHRSMGWTTTQGLDGGVESTRALVEVGPDLRRYVRRFHAIGDNIVATETRVTGQAPHGGKVDLTHQGVAVYEDGRFIRLEFFDLDDLEAALARYEELRTEDQTSSAIPETIATKTRRLVTDAFNRRDFDESARLLTEDFVFEDRRAGLKHTIVGRDGMLENMAVIISLGDTSNVVVPLAARGELLALHRLVFTGDQDFEVEMLEVTSFDDQGQVTSAVTFDPDDLDAAFADLDERFAAGEGEPFADEVRLLSEFVAAWNARDWDRVAATSIPDLVVVDHRPMGWGRLESVDAFVEATRVLTEMAPDLRMSITRFHGLGRGILAAALPITGRAQHGGQVELGAHIVVEVRAGRAHHVELFDAEDLDAARTRFEELRSERRPTGPAENDAYREMVRSVAAQVRGDWEVVAASITDDITFEDRRRGLSWVMEGKEEVMAHLRAAFSVDGMTSQESLIATRGERLCLGRQLVTVDDYEVELLVLGEIGEDGVTCWCIDFDPDDLDAAFAELDERFLSGEGAPYADVLRHGAMQRAVAVAGDWDAWRDLIDENVVLVDHRPTSLGEVRGVKDVLEASRTLVGLVRDARPRVVAYHGLATDRTLIEVRAFGTADHGGEVELSYLRLQQLRDGRVVRIELFPLEDLDAARTRFTELRTASEEPLT